LILASAFSALTGDMPTFTISTGGALAKRTTPFTAVPLADLPGSFVVLSYTSNCAAVDRRMAKYNRWSLAHPLEKR